MMLKSMLVVATAMTMFAGTAQAQSMVQTSDTLANANTNLGSVYRVTTTTDAKGRSTTVNGSIRYSSGSATRDVWRQQNVGSSGTSGNGTVGITTDYKRSGDGSALFEGTAGNYKADLEIYFSKAVQLSTVTGLSYDAYRDSSSTTAAYFTNSLRMIIGNASGNSVGTYLIFEPVYNDFPTASPIKSNTWYDFDITGSTTVYANNGNLTEPAGTGSCAGCYASLDAWKAANPNLTVIGLSTGIGSGWGGTYRGAVDNISFTAGGVTRSWNFEAFAAATPAVPEPASWAMMIGGIGLVGGAMRRRRSVRAVFAAA